jgi:Xaa-Pro aminopeptidase
MARLRERLPDMDCDGLLVTKLVNIQYLTGFDGSAGYLLVTADDARLLTDGRYRDQSASQAAAAGAEVQIEIGRPPAQLQALDRATKAIRRLGLEARDVTWATLRRLEEGLSSRPRLVPTTDAVESLRRTKDEAELARIERAADIADVALAQVKGLLSEGPTEGEFAVALDYEMRRRGADDVAFDTIVASGPNSAMPHARPSRRRIDPGEPIVIDFGATVEGYRSDMTRTVVVGPVVNDQLRDVLEAVLAAQRAGTRALRPGVTGAEIDSVCRESLSSAGFGDAFLHGTGHGVGLEIHEGPALSSGSADILEAGAVVTVEPGAYLYGTGGARIEDTLVLTENGARTLTKSTKDYTL